MQHAACSDEKLQLFARYSSCMGIGFHILSYYEEDTGHEAAVTIRSPESGCEIAIVDENGCNEDTLDAARNALPRILSTRLRSFSLECVHEAYEPLRYRTIVLRIIERMRYTVLDCMRAKSLSGVEHFYIAGWSGDYATGTGDEHSITLPTVPGVVFIHTHPSACYPSSKDLTSFADFLASGGLVEAIVSPSCSLALYLEEPMVEDDYWRLQKAARCVSRSRGPDEYMECIQALTRLGSVRTSLL